MIHVLATIELQRGCREPFLQEFLRIVPAVRAEDGCLAYGAAVDAPAGLSNQAAERPEVVIVIEQWRDLPSLHAHLSAPHMTAYRARVKDLVARTTLQVLRPVEPV